mgnify:FL=1
MNGKVVPFGGNNRRGGGGTTSARVEVTEDSLAIVFANEFADTARFDHHSGKWFVWDGQRWGRNDTFVALDWCRGICRRFGALDTKIAKVLGKAGAIGGVERLARVDQRLAVTSNIFDRDPMLFGTPDGTIDLRDGEMRLADQGDYITRLAAVGPSDYGVPPYLWLSFLEQTTRGDRDLMKFLQVACGYCLTGLTTEHSLFFVYGKGGNGKSVFLNTIRGILGEYAVNAPMETFTHSQGDQHPTGLAMLKGARLVTATETEEGRAWAESRIKQLTGGDPVTARFMRQDFFEFIPSFKLFIVGNHKPVLRNIDDAARRRFRLTPFAYRPDQPDPELETKLRAEWPAILRWMIDGCLMWQKDGLPSPDAVRKETNAYFDDQDVIGQWLADECDLDAANMHIAGMRRTLSSKLFGAWAAWCQRNGEQSGSGKRFSQDLEKRGFLKKRGIAGVEFYGLSLRNRSKHDGM